MNSTATRAVTLLALLLVLGAVNYSIYGKEQIIRTGEVIYLEPRRGARRPARRESERAIDRAA